MSDLSKQLAEEFSDKEYAHAYMEEFNNMTIAAQIKALREQRGMTQQELAQRSGMKQERISALENVDYDAWTIKTLQKLARAFDVSVKMSFQAFSEGIMDVVNIKKERLEVLPREEDLKRFCNYKVIIGKDDNWKPIDSSNPTSIRYIDNIPADIRRQGSWINIPVSSAYTTDNRLM